VAALRAARLRAAEPSLFDQAFAPETLRLLDRVRLRAQHASGDRPGNTRVRNRGDVGGTELERHVAYARGDDLRRIDWNVYARLDELVTRRFVAEREVPIWFVMDSSGSMGPDEAGSKLDMARAIAAILGTVSLSGGDRVYLAAIPGRKTGASDAALSCGPLRSRRSLAELRAFLAGVHQADGEGDLAAGLDRLLRQTRRGMVILISDFLVDRESLFKGLEMLKHRKHDVLMFHVLDDDEIEFPFAGTTRFEGMEELPNLLCDPRALRDGYIAALNEYLVEVRRGATRMGIDYALVKTSDYLDAVLSKYLHHRMADRATTHAR